MKFDDIKVGKCYKLSHIIFVPTKIFNKEELKVIIADTIEYNKFSISYYVNHCIDIINSLDSCENYDINKFHKLINIFNTAINSANDAINNK